jgi:hypothetical protein
MFETEPQDDVVMKPTDSTSTENPAADGVPTDAAADVEAALAGLTSSSLEAALAARRPIGGRSSSGVAEVIARLGTAPTNWHQAWPRAVYQYSPSDATGWQLSSTLLYFGR